MLLTEGAHDERTTITIKDTADSVFEVISSARGNDVENSVSIKKIRSMIPKSRMVRLTIRDGRLATETIRRIQ